ncbi:hypothetical protein CDAR_85981 [Caerostris darwini]|uniref:Uncharacterized protein n=1 Tax=Caerostris darwini TaxID=1538125 RepID=A0AAV4V4A4_9ARAC|nr:hypothetical protein CDAR_85981 [Caerostris darwini]
MTERDKVRNAPCLGKQAATGPRGSSVLPHSYNLSRRDIYLNTILKANRAIPRSVTKSSSLIWEKQNSQSQQNSSTRRFKWMCNKRATTGRNKRSTLTMTERDKVREAPSLGKQAATGTPFCPRGYNLSGRDIYL